MERAELLRRRRRGGRGDLGGDELRHLDRAAGLAPLYLTYYTYKVYLGRIDDERRHV